LRPGIDRVRYGCRLVQWQSRAGNCESLRLNLAGAKVIYGDPKISRYTARKIVAGRVLDARPERQVERGNLEVWGDVAGLHDIGEGECAGTRSADIGRQLVVIELERRGAGHGHRLTRRHFDRDQVAGGDVHATGVGCADERGHGRRRRIERVNDRGAGAGIASRVGVLRRHRVGAVTRQCDALAPRAVGLDRRRAKRGGAVVQRHGAAGIRHIHRPRHRLRGMIGQAAGTADRNQRRCRIERIDDRGAGAGIASRVGVLRRHRMGAVTRQGDARAPRAVGLDRRRAQRGGAVVQRHNGAGIRHIHRPRHRLRRMIGQTPSAADCLQRRGGVEREGERGGASIAGGVGLARQMVCDPSVKPLGVNVQAPLLLAVAVAAIALPSTVKCTTALGSPDPVSAGFEVILSLDDEPVSCTNASVTLGITVSTVKTCVASVAGLPAASDTSALTV
jgi:hypothetical protein